jgi:elongation factor G
MALQDACKRANPILLEPMMSVEVVTPEEYLGDIIGNLNSRRGKISGIIPRKDAQVVTGLVPLAEMFGYATQLRSISQGRAIYTMQFSHYEALPELLVSEVIEKTKG